MDSEIKLRAWDRDNKKMIYFDGITFWEDNKFWGQTENNQSLWRGTYKNLILMQYTGLKDKNEKEIYEGDIVEHKHRRKDWKEIIKKGIVTYRCPSFIFAKDFSNTIIDYYGLSVIGNIHENPELIKEA